MFRMERKLPQADLGLAVALVNAWVASEDEPSTSESRAWLKTISPLGLRMIDAARTQGSSDAEGDKSERRILMEVTIKHLGQTKFEIHARQHVIQSDQPVENGGNDASMTPPELFLASLGSCAAYYATQFLLHRKLADQGLEVSVTAEKLKVPSRLGNFVVQVKSPVPLTPDQTASMERSVHQCLIHQTLLRAPRVQIKIENGASDPQSLEIREVHSNARGKS